MTERKGEDWGGGERGKNSEALEGVEEETRVHHPRSLLDQDSILLLETRLPAGIRSQVVFSYSQATPKIFRWVESQTLPKMSLSLLVIPEILFMCLRRLGYSRTLKVDKTLKIQRPT